MFGGALFLGEGRCPRYHVAFVQRGLTSWMLAPCFSLLSSSGQDEAQAEARLQCEPKPCRPIEVLPFGGARLQQSAMPSARLGDVLDAL